MIAEFLNLNQVLWQTQQPMQPCHWWSYSCTPHPVTVPPLITVLLPLLQITLICSPADIQGKQKQTSRPTKQSTDPPSFYHLWIRLWLTDLCHWPTGVRGQTELPVCHSSWREQQSSELKLSGGKKKPRLEHIQTWPKSSLRPAATDKTLNAHTTFPHVWKCSGSWL